MAAYDATPAGETRRAVLSGAFDIPGDPDRMIDAMLACADATPAPLRLTLGGSSHDSIRAALTERLAALDAQRAIAFSTDRQARKTHR